MSTLIQCCHSVCAVIEDCKQFLFCSFLDYCHNYLHSTVTFDFKIITRQKKKKERKCFGKLSSDLPLKLKRGVSTIKNRCKTTVKAEFVGYNRWILKREGNEGLLACFILQAV